MTQPVQLGPKPLVKLVKLSALRPAPWNPRLISDARFQNLCNSISADPGLLWSRPVLAVADGTIYAGHMRYRAAEAIGLRQIPAIVEDIPEHVAKERALRDNAQWGEWDDDELSLLMRELEQLGSAVDVLGFDGDEIERLLAESEVSRIAGADAGRHRRRRAGARRTL